MAGSLNKVELIGNLGKDPEIRKTQDGRSIANMSIATSDTWRDKNTGERREKTEWHRVVCFNEGICKVIEQYVRKGDKVFVCGNLQTRKWTDQSGAERYSTEVVMNVFGSQLILLGGGRDGGGDDSAEDGFDRPQRRAVAERSSRNRDFDDDIPF